MWGTRAHCRLGGSAAQGRPPRNPWAAPGKRPPASPHLPPRQHNFRSPLSQSLLRQHLTKTGLGGSYLPAASGELAALSQVEEGFSALLVAFERLLATQVEARLLGARVGPNGRLFLWVEFRIGRRARQSEVAAGDTRGVFRLQLDMGPGYVQNRRDAWAEAWG